MTRERLEEICIKHYSNRNDYVIKAMVAAVNEALDEAANQVSGFPTAIKLESEIEQDILNLKIKD